LESVEAHPLPDDVAIRPELPGDRFGHDRDACVRSAFRSREVAAAHDIDAEHIEVFGRYGFRTSLILKAERQRSCENEGPSSESITPE
jgi:hypothetical protein